MAKNIVMIMTDQMHKNALGVIDEKVITPNLDGLSKEGILFSNAYSNNPVCGPFRGCLFTGRHSKDNRVLRNNDPLPDDLPTMATIFNKAGYETSFVGKWHLGGSGNGPIPEYLRGGFKHFLGYQCYNSFWVDNYFYDENDEEHGFDGHRTETTSILAVERLNMLADIDKPFVHVVFYQSPHYPEQPTLKAEQLYMDSDVNYPPNYIETDPYTPTYSPRSAKPVEYCSDYQRYGNDMKMYKRLYNAMVTLVDDGVGQIIKTLKDRGLYDETMILFSSDHGDMQGSHGLLNKCVPYDESCGIPLILKGKGIDSGTCIDLPVSSVDYLTTVLSYASIKNDYGLEGRNLIDVANNPAEYEGDVIYAENYQTDDDWAMIRDKRYKLVMSLRTSAPISLFDMKVDQYEMTNLVSDDEYMAIRERLVEKLTLWLWNK